MSRMPLRPGVDLHVLQVAGRPPDDRELCPAIAPCRGDVIEIWVGPSIETVRMRGGAASLASMPSHVVRVTEDRSRGLAVHVATLGTFDLPLRCAWRYRLDVMQDALTLAKVELQDQDERLCRLAFELARHVENEKADR